MCNYSIDKSSTTSNYSIIDNRNGTFTINGTFSDNVSIIADTQYFYSTHKYILFISPKQCNGITITISGYNKWSAAPLTNSSTYDGLIVTCNITYGSQPQLSINPGTYTNVTLSPMVIDLSVLYGCGKEPTLTKFKEDYFNWFGIPLGGSDFGGSQMIHFGGKQINFNQLIPNGNFTQGQGGWGGSGMSITMQDNIGIVNATDPNGTDCRLCCMNLKDKLVQGHIYYFSINVKKSSAGANSAALYIILGTYENAGIYNDINWHKYSRVIKNDLSSMSEDHLRFLADWTAIASRSTHYVKNAMCIDLTQIYGVGNEPMAPGGFETDYRDWFGHELEYESYTLSETRTINNTFKTIGFNQWDEKTALGYIDLSTGKECGSMNQLKSLNYIDVLESTEYFMKAPNNAQPRICYYDYDRKFISGGLINGTTFTTPPKCRYIRFYLTSSYGSYYNNNICINISKSAGNDIYEQYNENIMVIPVTSLTGKLNGVGQSVTIFPDGMKSAGDIYDEITVDGNIIKAIKRIGSITRPGDLGLNISGVDNTFALLYTSWKKSHKVVATRYALSANQSYNALSDGSIMMYPDGYSASNWILIRDTVYSDLTTFKSALNSFGVVICGELNTYEEYVIDNNNFILPQNMNINKDGTELITPHNYQKLISTCPLLTIKYNV